MTPLGVQQLQRINKRTENDDGLIAPAQFLHKVTQRWQFELRGNSSPGCEHRETFRIRPHFPRPGTAAIVLNDEINAVLKTATFGLGQSDGQVPALLRRQVQQLGLSAMKDQRSCQRSEFLELAGT